MQSFIDWIFILVEAYLDTEAKDAGFSSALMGVDTSRILDGLDNEKISISPDQ